MLQPQVFEKSSQFGRGVLILTISLWFCSPAAARIVNSMDDEVRVSGFQDYLEHLNKLEQRRLSDVEDIKTERFNWEKKMAEALEVYRVEKAYQEKTVDDTGPEYKEELDSRLEEFQTQNEARNSFVEARDHIREIEKRDVSLTEEAEYFLASNTDRADWHKRKFFEQKGSSGSSGIVSPNPNYNGFNDSPPPPPPAIPYEPPQQSWEAPPPPPPGTFDYENNPF